MKNENHIGLPMHFEDVVIVGVGHADAPIRVNSAELEDPLGPTLERLGMPIGMLESLTGIRARRFWEPGFRPSSAATLAGRRVIEQTGVDPSRIGVLVSTSVSRDYVEPSNACFVHQNLGLDAGCLNFDLGNACLAFINAIDLVGNMIERGQIDYGLIVDGESSRDVVESTVERLSRADCDAQTLRDQFATLTLGSGAAAMLLGHSRLAPEGHQYIGSVNLAATQHNQLCCGQLDGGVTDTTNLMIEGVALAERTWAAAIEEFGWTAESVDLFAMHQVSQVHTQRMAQSIGFSLERTVLLYPEYGNVGPASIPMVLSRALEQQRLNPGDRVVLGGIGSGLNCTAAHVLW